MPYMAGESFSKSYNDACAEKIVIMECDRRVLLLLLVVFFPLPLVDVHVPSILFPLKYSDR